MVGKLSGIRHLTSWRDLTENVSSLLNKKSGAVRKGL
jgi:hypothetical protein